MPARFADNLPLSCHQRTLEEQFSVFPEVCATVPEVISNSPEVNDILNKTNRGIFYCFLIFHSLTCFQVLIVLLQVNDKSLRLAGPKKKNDSELSKNHYSDNHSPDSDLAVQKMKQELPSHYKDTKPIRQLPQFYFPIKGSSAVSPPFSSAVYSFTSSPICMATFSVPSQLPSEVVRVNGRSNTCPTKRHRIGAVKHTVSPFLHQRYMTSIHCLWQQ